MQSRISSLLPMLIAAGALALAACGGADVAPQADAAPLPDARVECPNPEPEPSACDFFLSCGCAVAEGKKCSVDVTTHERDCFRAGTLAPGATCVSEVDCQAVSLCAVFGGGTAQRCMQYCDATHACPTTPAEQACYIPVSGVADAHVCGQVCSLLGQDCELADQGCYPSAIVTTMEKGVCAQAAAGAELDTCSLANDCRKGLTCLTTDHKCHKLCDRGAGAGACTNGTCQAMPGHTATGICQ